MKSIQDELNKFSQTLKPGEGLEDLMKQAFTPQDVPFEDSPMPKYQNPPPPPPRKLQDLQEPPLFTQGPARYIVTSDKYSGSAELLYMNGLIQEIKMQETNMSGVQRAKFKLIVPEYEAKIAEFQKASGATIVQTDYPMTFDMFWNQYGKVFPGKKVNKPRCTPLWEKLSKTEQVKAYYGIEAYEKGARKNGRTLFVDPERYLRDKTWQNEY